MREQRVTRVLFLECLLVRHFVVDKDVMARLWITRSLQKDYDVSFFSDLLAGICLVLSFEQFHGGLVSDWANVSFRLSLENTRRFASLPRRLPRLTRDIT